MKFRLTVIYLSLLLVLICTFQLQAQTYKLKNNEFFKKGKNICIYVKGKWQAGKKIDKNSFERKKNPKAKERNYCKSLLKPSKKRSLTQFPKPEDAVAARLGVNAVSGNAPTISEIVAAGADNVFFRPGVVSAISNNSASQEQCSEFWSGQTDGHSGGIGACYMAENVIYSVSEVARSGTSMCYMRNFPTTANLNAGAVQVVSGNLPNGQISQVFNTPSGSSPRIVKVGVAAGEGETNIFMRIYSEDQNAEQGNQYKFDIWFCDNSPNGEAQEYEQSRITAGGEYIASSVHSFGEGNGTGGSTIRGFLARSGTSLIFDSNRERTVSFGGRQTGDFASNFKSTITINADNEITTKIRQIFGSDQQRKAFSVARFEGAGISNLRFLEGASKEENNSHNFTAASEFRDSYYAASPESSYASQASAINFEADSFYGSGARIPEINAEFPCNAEADIELGLDMEHEAMLAVAEECEGDRIDGGDTLFCQSEAMSAAQNNWQNACMP